MNILRILVSTKVTLVLLLLYAIAMAVATFVENDYGIPVSWALIYNAWWFELIQLWLAINFLFHFQQYKLFHKNRWPVGLFHISFVIILLGAGVTRYTSMDGSIHIREGMASNTVFTNAHYLQVRQAADSVGQKFEMPMVLIDRGFEPIEVDVAFDDARFKVVIDDYLKGAREVIVEGNRSFVDIAVATEAGRQDYVIDIGRTLDLESIRVTASEDSTHPVRIFRQDTTWMIATDIELHMMDMSSTFIGTIAAESVQPIALRTLYNWPEGAFLIKGFHENADVDYVEETNRELAENLLDIVTYRVLDDQGDLVRASFVRIVRFEPAWTRFEYGGRQYAITFGPKPITLPFSLFLREFDLERYPGSQSPSSYASEVTVLDGETQLDYRIFMNNVLDYRGYRFYQASYDTDEKGTILSVNQDRPGTLITYLGYTLLTIGMFLTLFIRGSRFQTLNKKLGRVKKSVAATASVALLPILLYTSAMAQEFRPVEMSIVPVEHAEKYGRLIVQDLDGRMKPLNTLAHEIMRKLTGTTWIGVEGEVGEIRLTPEQFLLAMQIDPVTMSHQRLIKIDPMKSSEVLKHLGKESTDRLRFMDFVDAEGAYLIQSRVEHANRLKPAERSEAFKEILKLDERFNIFYGLITGDFLRLFPKRGDANNTWFTGMQSGMGFDPEDATFVRSITPMYINALKKGIETGDFAEADEILGYIALFQEKAGEAVYPGENEIKAELLYTRLNLGARLFGPFWLLGAVMLVLSIVMLFKSGKALETSWRVGSILSWIGFGVFTFHLLLRWYIAKHPPWSDGFEMLVFVAWGVLLFGLLFAGKSRFTLPLGLLFAGTLLFVGFLDWLNPEITNLMPVLKTFWLKIHVSIIVSGYAPLALSAVIGLMSLMLFIFRPEEPNERWFESIRELRMVNEMSITIGLFLLTVGTFLGGVWANESWGRYWAWDPKETWALISIIVYAIVLHMRLVPSLNSGLIYNLASLWAFSSIIMTSFGVNYYLSGLHSYAAGDPVPIPQWVYWVVALLFAVSCLAAYRYKADERYRV
jgi:cytochrome c-type biogenesis protein CcsB